MASRAAIQSTKSSQNSVALPFEQVLSLGVVIKGTGRARRQYLKRYIPRLILWAWLSQVLDVDLRLVTPSAEVIAWTSDGECLLRIRNLYSRKRLPLAVLKPLLTRTATALASGEAEGTDGVGDR